MDINVEINRDALRRMDAILGELPAQFQRNAYRSTITAGARVIATRARKEAPARKDSGLLKKSIGYKAVVYRSGVPYAVIGSKRSVSGVDKNGDPVIPANYAHLVHNPTAHSNGNPYMQRAADSSGPQAIQRMHAAMERALARIATRMGSKARTR